MPKTHTRRLRPGDYISTAGQLNLTRLVDDACAALAFIRCNGVGRQQRRSRGVIIRSHRETLLAAGFTPAQASEHWRDQVMAIDALNANADDDGGQV